MELMEIVNLVKNFKVLNRREGVRGALLDLFSKDYRIVKAVDDISFSLKQGEIIGFIGPNGAGKSTTIKMLTGMLQPTSGNILVNGINPFKKRNKFLKNIGVVFGQRTQLWWDIPVIESFKLLKEIYNIDKPVYEKNINTFDELVNIKQLYSKPVRSLSLGQRTLCDIAASFLHNPRLIFLDEPTIGLDISVKNKIRKLILDLNQKYRNSIIMCSHDLGDIEQLCKRIVVIDKGKIIYDGKLERINKLFGSYRILRIELANDINTDFNKGLAIIKNLYPAGKDFTVTKESDNWIKIVVNQDSIPLLSILKSAIENLPVKDVSIEEIKLENVISKIYDGELK